MMDENPICRHLKRGRCNRYGEVIAFAGGGAIGGDPCICWDECGHMKDGVRFKDCKRFERW
jgi:hypothetical protein